MREHIQPIKVVIINILITFVEGFAAAWLVAGNKIDKTALVGAAAAGLSAVWNLVVKPFLKSQDLIYKKA